jgi:hypothetical protein
MSCGPHDGFGDDAGAGCGDGVGYAYGEDESPDSHSGLFHGGGPDYLPLEDFDSGEGDGTWTDADFPDVQDDR